MEVWTLAFVRIHSGVMWTLRNLSFSSDKMYAGARLSLCGNPLCALSLSLVQNSHSPPCLLLNQRPVAISAPHPLDHQDIHRPGRGRCVDTKTPVQKFRSVEGEKKTILSSLTTKQSPRALSLLEHYPFNPLDQQAPLHPVTETVDCSSSYTNRS